MAIAVLPSSTLPEQSQATATLAILCSPIRGADGAWRHVRQEVPSDRPLSICLPEGLQVDRLIVNGGVVSPDAWDTTVLLPGDEALLIPQWGAAFGLIGALISIAVSIGVSALSYALMPNQQPHAIKQSPDEPTFSFAGIQTAVGPGAVVPVIYGRFRVGGQLLSASVDQALTVLDDGTGTQRVRALSSPATLSLLLALGEGPVAAIDPATILINGQPSSNFPTVQIWTNLGSATQLPLPTFGETSNTFSDGRPIPETLSSIMYTTTVPVEAFVLNVIFASGLYAFNPKGEKVDNVTTLQYRFRAHATMLWGSWASFVVSANRTSVVRFGIRKENIDLDIYDIELQVTNVQSVVNAEWQPTLESVTEIQHNTNAYPYTALLGLRALATDSLQGALPNVTVEVLGRTVRVGSFAIPPNNWSDNPAWCVMDFLTDTRYGVGLSDAEIDLGSFATWAAYCDQLVAGEKRHTFNYVLDKDSRVQPTLLEMMGGSRTLLCKSEGLWMARPTRNDPPVQLLSWTNGTDLRLTYGRDTERINVMECRFANEETNFQQDVLTWPVLASQPAIPRKASIELRGVTKPSRVMRAMQFELNRRFFEQLTLEMTCSLEAITLQLHDLFRFSHPLPGWGRSGRLMAGCTTSTLVLDEPVTFVGAQSYLVYVRHQDDTVEMRSVLYQGDITTTHLVLLSALSQVPVPRTSTWAFGHVVSTADSAVKVFRVTKIQRLSSNQVQLQAVIHNPSLYDEGDAVPLPVTTELFNPLGPPPPLTSLILTEVTRIQSSGASLRVVNLSWDVAALSQGFAPYGGAMIQRRTVLESSLAGTGVMGGTLFGQLQMPTDVDTGFQPLHQVTGHVLDWDDYTVLTGTTYVYRVIPVSSRGIPNIPGAREAIIHVAGPTTPGYFPGTVLNLRLQGQPVGATEFEGPDIHVEWDDLSTSSLFSETFFIQDYILEVWAPGQLFLLRRVTVLPGPKGQPIRWTYTLDQNAEDHVRQGYPGAQRTVQILVWARTNTGLMSLVPATITVTNPPPDMSNMIPEVMGLFQAALIDWSQFVEPRDFDHYNVYLDTVNPPQVLYQDVAIAFRKLFPGNLLANVQYWVYILPFDTFGPGLASQIATFTPVAIDADSLDTVPPALPTGLALTTGTTLSSDGTVQPWVEAHWTANTEADLAGYEVHFFVGTSTVPTVMVASRPRTTIRLENIGGNVAITARMLAYDKFHNLSPFTADVTITTGQDTTAPGLPTTMQARGSFRANILQWIPPSDLDYVTTEVWASQTNQVATATRVGEGQFDFVHDGLLTQATWYYWLRSRDSSGNVSAYTPGATAGLPATTVPTSSADIGNLSITSTQIADNAISTPKLQANSVDANKITAGELITLSAQIRNAVVVDGHITNLTASKITAGILNVLMQIGVSNNIFIDGLNHLISIYDSQPTPRLRVAIGRLGLLSQQWGAEIFDENGNLQWAFTTGAQTAGIADNAITATKITAATINSTHLRTDTAVITVAAQIANALITNAHIVNLAADKILAGTLGVLVQLGVGNSLFMDGTQENLYVYDHQSPRRIRGMFGRMGAGSADYGLRVWDELGQLMYNFTNGAQTPGIAPNAVTVALSFAQTFTTVVTSTELALANLTVGPIAVGDQIWLMGKVWCTINTTDGGLDLRLWENGIGSVLLDVTRFFPAQAFVDSTLVVTSVYTVTSAASAKTFTLAARNPFTVQSQSVSYIDFVLLHRKR